MSDPIYTSDIYNISDTINQLQKNFMDDISQDTLAMSMFGYLNDIFSKTWQNTVVMASEWGNEAFPIRAKFEKTILTDAITYNISNINAIPAKIKVMIGFIESELNNVMTGGKYTIDKNCIFEIGDYQFHLDYDVTISKEILPLTKEVLYTALYDIDNTNLISDISNPYIEPPLRLVQDNDTFIFISCTLRQVQVESVFKKIISNSALENKTIDFDFEDQLAAFEVAITESDGTVKHITPIFEGIPPNTTNLYCYYTFMDTNSIRVRFDNNSYEPSLNSQVELTIKTTQGTGGNFKYTKDSICSITSSTNKYSGISSLVKPLSDSYGGLNRKSTDELKQIIPKEILSRGNITNNKDLENYFNMIDDDNKLMFYRRRDNQFERLYYAYLLAKDENDNIIPTNTIDIEVTSDQFDLINEDRLIISPGNVFSLDTTNQVATLNNSTTESDKTPFLYSSPFYMVLNKNMMSTSYYLDVVDNNYNFKFSYINTNSFLQFISTYMNCKKVYLSDNQYKITMSITQNSSIDKSLVQLDDNGNVIKCDIKPVLAINAEHTYYVFGKVVSYSPSTFTYQVEFTLDPDNDINNENKIKINNLLLGGTGETTHAYIDDSVSMSVYLYAKFDAEYGRDKADLIITGMEGYTLCNRYDTEKEVSLFYNYSNNIKSTAIVEEKLDDKTYKFKIKGVPMVRHSYLDNEDRCLTVIDYIQRRKVYIDDVLEDIENSFVVDFKFFNTYGPSNMFYIGHDKQTLDRVNISLKFNVKLRVGANKNLATYMVSTIKEYIENLNKIDSVHMTNLTTILTEKYGTDLYFVEFAGINDYPTSMQYLERDNQEIINRVPEFININLKDGETPDIEIIPV